MPEETVVSPASLSNAQRGQLAELIFIRKAASLGFAVAKPWNEGERYDAIVRVGHALWRVQVKSVLAKRPSWPYYRVTTAGGRNGGRGALRPYSAGDIDFLAAYIFAEDTWYVFPAAVILNKASVCIRPGCKRSKYETYREAWHLMRVDTEPAQTSTESCVTNRKTQSPPVPSDTNAPGILVSTRAVAADCVGSVDEASGAPRKAVAKATAAKTAT